jgi:transposase-like protein
MSQRRQPCTEISGNRRRRPNLTPDQRLQIIAKASAGVTTKELVKEFDRDSTTIRRVIRTATTRTTTTELPRSGRPPTLSRY